MSSIFLKTDFNHRAPSVPKRPEKRQRHRRLAQTLLCAAQWIQAHIKGIDSRRVPHLQLEFPDRFVNFRSMKEFEFALSSRTEFPAARMRDLIALTPVELEERATKIRQVERDFTSILTRTEHHPELIGEYCREIEIKLFSQDHGWRELMEALVRLSPAYDMYKRVALIKYIQYLRARQNIMRSLFIDKTQGDDSARVHATRQSAQVTQFVPTDTAIFDLPQIQATDNNGDTNAYAALAKGETTTLHLGQEREVELLLGGNRLRLYTGRDFYMADDDNITYPLHAGKNLVGRHSVCDVVVNAAWRAVSRNHLIVQPISAQEIRLTDLSSHGTEVPARLLRHH